MVHLLVVLDNDVLIVIVALDEQYLPVVWQLLDLLSTMIVS
jgi:hypothetical protein